MVDSTKNTSGMISPDKIQGFYSVFLNTMSQIIRIHRGRVIKNSGDGLLYYFPRTKDPDDHTAFIDVIECGLTMIDAYDSLNLNFQSKGISPVNYRISANYGKVELAISLNSQSVDLFGPTVNVCSKINHLAESNRLIIHENLLAKIKETPSYIKNYEFKKVDTSEQYALPDNGIEFKIYVISRSNNNNTKAKNLGTSQPQNYDPFYKNTINVSKSSFNILLIDDDEDILFAFKSIISSEGYNVTTFSNATYALADILEKNANHYHLIIMDIRMPEINGIKLYSHLRVLNPDAKVIFLSALNAIDEVLSIFPEIDHKDIMRKPVEPDHLLASIQMILQSTTE
jgi:CheY-like chemotaxis protein/class 3 adenylate cyclase